jgi:chromosome partitioning protein
MITLAFFNNKGGVGKSTAAINVAHAMTRLEKRVVVVDCDNQKNTFGFFSDGNGKSTKVSATRYENLDVLQGARRKMSGKGSKEFIVPDDYDYAILDMPPTLDGTTAEVLGLTDFVFVPIELGTFAIQGIANVTETIAATGARFGGCFVNKFDRDNPADHKLDALLRSTLGNKAMTAVIPYSRVIKNSVNYRMTAFEYMEWTEAAGAYMSLTREITAICEGDE